MNRTNLLYNIALIGILVNLLTMVNAWLQLPRINRLQAMGEQMALTTCLRTAAWSTLGQSGASLLLFVVIFWGMRGRVLKVEG